MSGPITGDRREGSIPPEVLEPVRCQRGIDGRAGDRPMAEPALDRPVSWPQNSGGRAKLRDRLRRKNIEDEFGWQALALQPICV
jgi:hypothetical protein